MLLEDLLKEFILELEIRNYLVRTLKGYRNNNLLMFTYIKKEFNINEVEEVRTLHIKSYIKFLQRQKRKPIYINGIVKCFRALFKYAVEEEIIEINPIHIVRRLTMPRYSEIAMDDDSLRFLEYPKKICLIN